MKRLLIPIAAFVGILVFFSINQPQTKARTVTINNRTFTVEVADSDEKRAQGLSNRDRLDANEGMLFVFPTEGRYSFWMKEMNFPIDIIFIRDRRIVTIYKDVPPPPADTALTSLTPYLPKEPVTHVLEINAGLSETYGVQEGDTVIVTNIR